MSRRRPQRAAAQRALQHQQQGLPAAVSAAPVPGAYTGDYGAGGNAPLRRATWQPVARDANADTLRTLALQRGQSRELARTHPIAAGAIGTYLDRVVGTGLALVSQPDRRVLGWTSDRAQAWKRHVQAEFSLWADSAECDLTAAGNFYDRQRLVAGARAESGDCFTLLPDASAADARRAGNPYRLRLQLLEADRIGNPGAAMDSPAQAGGVRRDANGRPLAYHVYHQHPGTVLVPQGNRWAGQWVEATGASGRRRMLHHWQPTRPEQTRGVPWFAPIVALLKDLDTFTDAAVKNAVVSTFVTAFITTPPGSGPAPVFGLTDAQAAAAGGEIALGPAAVVGLAEGEDVKFADPNHPSPNFQPFVEAICVQIGMALSIPFELLLKRFNASYSASRAALLDAWMFFRTQRTWLERSFCQPVYETWLAEAVASGRVEAPGYFTDPLLRWAYARAAWHGDSQGSINPKDEVAAYSAAVDARLMSRERAEWELFGTDWSDTYDAKLAEQQRLQGDDLLPAPKAGAAAPGAARAEPEPPESPAEPSAAERAQLELLGAVAALAAREPQPINVHIHEAPSTVTVEPAQVTLAEGCMQLEAVVQAPQVTVQPAQVHVDVPAPQVVVNNERPATRQLHRRDADGNLVETITQPLQ